MMSRNAGLNRMKGNPLCLFTLLLSLCLMFFPAVLWSIDHPTSNPYETRPAPDGFLTYQIIPTPAALAIDKDVMVTMPTASSSPAIFIVLTSRESSRSFWA